MIRGFIGRLSLAHRAFRSRRILLIRRKTANGVGGRGQTASIIFPHVETHMNHPILASIIISAAVVFSANATPARAADLTVTVYGVGELGNVMVALYKKDDKWMGKASAYNMTAALKAGVQVVFKDLAEGDYAISTFVDENSNRRLDTNAIGIPTEPYGFSNDAAGNFGPPSFEQARFSVGKDNKTITITFK